MLVSAIVDARADAGIDPADIDGFVSYGGDANEPPRLMNDLGTKDLRCSAQIWGGGGGGIAGTFGQAAPAIASGQAETVVIYRAMVQGDSGRMSTAVMAHHLNDDLTGAGLVAPAIECAMRAQRNDGESRCRRRHRRGIRSRLVLPWLAQFGDASRLTR